MILKHKKKLIWIAAIILALAIAGVAVTMVMNRQADEKRAADAANAKQAEQKKKDALLGETFTDDKTGVSMRLPKEWQIAPANPKDPNSVTRFEQLQTRANGELRVTKTRAHIDDIVRGYLEGALNVSVHSKLIANHDVVLGKRVVRLLSHDLPGPNGQTARLTQYIYYKDGTYYVLAYTMLSSDWEAQQAAIEASAESLEF